MQIDSPTCVSRNTAMRLPKNSDTQRILLPHGNTIDRHYKQGYLFIVQNMIGSII